MSRDYLGDGIAVSQRVEQVKKDGVCPVCKKKGKFFYPDGSPSITCDSDWCFRKWLLPYYFVARSQDVNELESINNGKYKGHCRVVSVDSVEFWLVKEQALSSLIMSGFKVL